MCHLSRAVCAPSPPPLVIQHLLLPLCHMPTLCAFSPLPFIGQHLLLLCVLLPGHVGVFLPPPFVTQHLLLLVLLVCAPLPGLCSQSRLFMLGSLVSCMFFNPVAVCCDTFLHVHFTLRVGIERDVCVCVVSVAMRRCVYDGEHRHTICFPPLPVRLRVSIVFIGKLGDGEGGKGGRVGVCELADKVARFGALFGDFG
jgi:hypothetical protein